MKSLKTLIATNEDWLVQRVLHHAKEQGYTDYTSTLEVPWRESVCGFSEPILRILEETDDPIALSSKPAQRHASVMAFAIEEARLHRQRGVPLNLYIGLTKYYRQAYTDLIAEAGLSRKDEARYRLFIDKFFDNAEIATCEEWTRASRDDQISEYAEKVRSLTNEKNRYLTIFESIDQPVILIDGDGRIKNSNHAALSLFEDSAIPGAGYYAPRDTPSLDRFVRDVLAEGNAPNGMERVAETAKGPRTFQVKVQPMLDVSEKFVGTVLILSDVTEYRRALQAADAASEAKSAFLATMSHEIRTPINGILGIGRLLQDQSLGERGNRYVEALLGSGEILLDLVNDVLDYTKLGAKAVVPEPVDFSPHDVVARVADLASAEVERKQLDLHVEIAPDVPEHVVGDRGKIQRTLVNLVGNAVKFTSEGSVTLSVKRSRGGLRFSVTDTGPGIPDAATADLFDPFVQHPIPGTRQPTGTGLGLAICKKLADMIDAKIGVQSREGEGSEFWLDCPLEDAPADRDPLSSPDASARALQPLEILLVEDNDVNALVIEGFAQRDGHGVETAGSGEAALESLTARRFDLVLMDIRMRGIGGIEAIRRIRAHRDPTVRMTPILAVTADSTNTSANTLLEDGADAVLEKPFTPEALRDAMTRTVSGNGGQCRPNDEAQNDSATEISAPVLDPAAIESHRAAVGVARTKRVVETFLAQAPAQAKAVRAAANDAAALADLSHTLKSSAEILGLKRLAEKASATEALAGEADPGSLAKLADTLAGEIEDAVSALTAAAASIDAEG